MLIFIVQIIWTFWKSIWTLCLSVFLYIGLTPKPHFSSFLFFRQQRRQANKTPCCVISLTTSASLPVSATILILSATIFCLGFIHQMVTTWKQLVPHSLSYGALTQSLQASERRKSLLETKDTNFIPLLFKSVPLSSRSKDWAMIFQQAADRGCRHCHFCLQKKQLDCLQQGHWATFTRKPHFTMSTMVSFETWDKTVPNWFWGSGSFFVVLF